MIQTNLPLNPLDNPINPIFARHETFHPRWGWLNKGFSAANTDNNIFSADDAPIRLGVGKNMVRSIRYWCNAFKVTENDDNPSDFGQRLLGENGWDKYLENPASLWLLHWHLLKPTCNSASWYYTFNLFNETEFSRNDLLNGLKGFRDEIKPNIADSSLNKDVTCILRMYVDTGDDGFVEDSIDSPFAGLGLIYQPFNGKNYRFRFGNKPNLCPEIVVASCLEYASWVSENQTTISISRLLYDYGSPGLVFKLTEEALLSSIDTMIRKYDHLFLADTAGLIQLSFNGNPLDLADRILDDFFLNN